MTSIRVRAPATSANLGPGFDCAGVALDLWNELEVTDGEGVEVAGEGAGEISLGRDHLGVRAFALVAPGAGKRFSFVNRIPLASGLGSSAATIALGVVAATLATRRRFEPEGLLRLALPLEGHPDNLAAALAGGVCLTWEDGGGQRIARIADTVPLVPLAVVPGARVETAAARAALPDRVPHAEAAFTAGRAALLGAGLAAGDRALVAAGFGDRLHEPYRAANAPLLGEIREQLPAGAAGATLSGSGPSVIVWAEEDAAEACADELRRRFPEAQVVVLAVSALGAAAV